LGGIWRAAAGEWAEKVGLCGRRRPFAERGGRARSNGSVRAAAAEVAKGKSLKRRTRHFGGGVELETRQRTERKWIMPRKGTETVVKARKQIEKRIVANRKVKVG
jgi:hypothetical protein